MSPLTSLTTSLRLTPRAPTHGYGTDAVPHFSGKMMPIRPFRTLSGRSTWTRNSPRPTICGQAYAKKGFYTQTISDSTPSNSLEARLCPGLLPACRRLLQKNNFEPALADLDAAVRLDPKLDDKARSLRVQIYESEASNYGAAGQWDKAIAYLKKAISLDTKRTKELNPQLTRPYGERGFDHANKREFPEAVRDLNMALDRDDYNAETHRLCGLACSKMASDYHAHVGKLPTRKNSG